MGLTDMKCPECDGQMVAGTITVGQPWWGWIRPSVYHLYFQQSGGRDAVVKHGETRKGYRCPKCQAIVISGEASA
jgi:hypothetical protein